MLHDISLPFSPLSFPSLPSPSSSPPMTQTAQFFTPLPPPASTPTNFKVRMRLTSASFPASYVCVGGATDKDHDGRLGEISSNLILGKLEVLFMDMAPNMKEVTRKADDLKRVKSRRLFLCYVKGRGTCESMWLHAICRVNLWKHCMWEMYTQACCYICQN